MATRDFGGILNTTKWVDTTDETKGILFNLTAVDTATTRTYSVPNGNTTLVGTDVSQTLTNKTLTGATNDIAANKLRLAGGNTIDFSNSPIPSPGQFLRASDSTNVGWETVSGLGNAFGSTYYIESENQIQSTNSTTFIIGTTFTTNIIPAGTYRVSITLDWLYDTDVPGRFWTLQLIRDGTIIHEDEFNIVKNRWFNYNMFSSDVITSDIHTYTILYKVNNKGDTVSLKDVKLELIRII